MSKLGRINTKLVRPVVFSRHRGCRMYRKFAEVPVGTYFAYEADFFKKTSDKLAWEYRRNKPYKERTFHPNDTVRVK